MPGSWEILKVRKERMLLSIITPPDLGVTMDFLQSTRGLQLPPGSDFMRVIGLPFDAARNQAAKAAHDNGYNLAFLDADLRVPPDAYIKLWETGLPYVSGLYYQRFYPFQPVMFNEGKDDKGQITRVPVAGWKPGDIVPCTFVPTGLLLIRHEMLQRMFQAFTLPFFWGVDIAPRPDFNGQTALPFSEDFTMSYRAKYVLGVQPHVATGIVGLHEVRAVVGPRWLIPLPSPDPTHGLLGVA